MAVWGGLSNSTQQTVLKESKLESAEAEKALKESTQDNYINAITELALMKDSEAIQQWEAKNITGKSPEELKAVFGLHRADLVTAVEKMRLPKTPEGNEQAFADWTMKVERGDAEWDDIKADRRLTPPQQAKLFGSLKKMTEQASLGYIPNAHLANRLLSELQDAWPNSVYSSPWSASQMVEPGKPPVVTPEGLYYQNEYLKRLRALDPKSDPQESNREKLELLQDVKNDITSGKLRWENNVGRTGEPTPQLRLAQRVNEGGTLTEAEVSGLAKLFNDGGTARIKDAFQVDYFKLDGKEQKRIAAEAQRQKAEIEAIKADSFFGRLSSFFKSDSVSDALDTYSMNIMGVPLDSYSSDPAVRDQPLVESVEREKARLDELEAQLVDVRDNRRGLSNLHVIRLQREITKQRTYYESLKSQLSREEEQ